MKLNITKQNDITIININAERATGDNAPALSEVLFNQIEEGNARKIIVDLKGVEFVDSTFLGALVKALKKITEKMGDIKVTNLEKPVRVMFELTRLYRVFEVFDNTNEAVASF